MRPTQKNNKTPKTEPLGCCVRQTKRTPGAARAHRTRGKNTKKRTNPKAPWRCCDKQTAPSGLRGKNPQKSPPPLPSSEVFALRNLDEEAYQERIEREKARRFQELLIQAEARLAPHLPYYYPRINVPISYYYNAYSKCIHRKLDPELRDKKLGQVPPNRAG